MQYMCLGRSGLKISRIGLGCMTYAKSSQSNHAWLLDEETSRPILRRAIELGINFFDTANIYSAGVSEEVLGRAIRDFARRDEVVIGSKLFNPMRGGPNAKGLSRKAIMTEIDDTLRRLGTDYVDLYQIHRYDATTPIEETLQALHDVVKAGKARYIGASTMYAWQFCKMLQVSERHGWTRFISMQNHMNLLYREEEREMMQLCAEEGVGMTPWSPLARGRLARPWQAAPTQRSETDQYARKLYEATQDADHAVVDQVTAVALARGVPQVQVALAWLLQKPAVVAPIVGATSVEQLDTLAGALDLRLTAEEVADVERCYVPHPVAGF